MRDIAKTVIMQYQHSPRLLALIEAFNAAIDPEPWLQEFFARVFDPATAESWGLDVWGRIVAASRTIPYMGSDWLPLGFLGQTCANFGHGAFYSGQAASSVTLADNAYRALIFFKAAANISNGTLPTLNRLLATFFADRGNIQVIHVGTMRLRVVAYFALRPWEMSILALDDYTPIPAGVGYELYTVNPPRVFGFKGTGGQNFGHGHFQPQGPQPIGA